MSRTPKPISFGKPAVAPPTSPLVYGNPEVMGMPTASTAVATVKPMQPIVLTINDQPSAAQSNIAAATSKITSIAKLSDMDELGKLLGSTLTAAKGYDPSSLKGKGGILGFLKGKVEGLRQNFERVDGVVNRLVGEIDKNIELYRSRVNDLEQIKMITQTEHDNLTAEIEHYTAGAAYMAANPPEIDPTDPFSAQKAQEWQRTIDWALQRADDHRRSQVVAQQQVAQINLMQQNSSALSQKFGNLKATTLPLLQSTFSLYVINMEQAKGAKMANDIDDLTDATIKKNAAALGANTVAIQTALGRSNVSIEAITANHDAVIKALDDIERIRAETKARLAREAPLLEQKSRELSERLARNNQPKTLTGN